MFEPDLGGTLDFEEGDDSASCCRVHHRWICLRLALKWTRTASRTSANRLNVSAITPEVFENARVLNRAVPQVTNGRHVDPCAACRIAGIQIRHHPRLYTTGLNRGDCPGGPPFVLMSDADGLKASAVAVALTLFPVFPQMREKKEGTPARTTCTVTSGLTPKGPPANETQLLSTDTPPAE